MKFSINFGAVTRANYAYVSYYKPFSSIVCVNK